MKQTDKIIKDNIELELKNKQILQAGKMAALGEMASGIAHEINNPLAIITGHSMILLQNIDKQHIDLKDCKDRLLKIQKTGHRIAKIISGLKTFARKEENDPFIIYSLRPLIDDTLEICSDRLQKAKITLIIEPIPDIKISCHPTQISQVFINLLNNAHDAIASLSIKWIKISFKKVDAIIEISVTDSGPGIASSIREKIFEPFFTTKEIGNGTGLGLSLSKSIIEMHGGELLIDPNSATTTFLIRLPIASLKNQAP